MYNPACFPVTESILSTEFRLPNLTVVIPANSFTGRPLKNHLNDTGASPVVTRHATLAESAKFEVSSPKSNGAIFGGTIKFNIDQLIREILSSFR